MVDVYIPKQATFLFAAPTRRRGGAMFEIGVIGLTAIGHSGFAIGVVRRALDELRSITIERTANLYLDDLAKK